MESTRENYGGCGVPSRAAEDQLCAMRIKRECKDGDDLYLGSHSQQGLTNGAYSGAKKCKPIPPPLDLTVRNLDHSHQGHSVYPLTSPKSPPIQKHLPLRKRALSWSNLGDASNSGQFVSASLDLSFPCGREPPPSSLYARGGPECDNAEAPPSPEPLQIKEESVPPRSLVPTRNPLKFSIASLGLEGLLTPASSSSSSQPSSVASSAEALDSHFSGSISPAKRSSRNFFLPPINASPQLPLDLSTSPSCAYNAIPAPVWGCFLGGTKVSFRNGEDDSWISVEELGRRVKEEHRGQPGVSLADCGRGPLHVHKVERVTNGSDLTFAIIHFKVSDGGPVAAFLAACAVDHPFFVRDAGWSSVFPDMMTSHYGLPCRELSAGDVVARPSASSASGPSGSAASHALSPLPKSAGLHPGVAPADCHTSLTPDLETRLKVFTFPPPPHLCVSEAVSMPNSPFLAQSSRLVGPHSPYARSLHHVHRPGPSGLQSPAAGLTSYAHALAHQHFPYSPPGSASASGPSQSPSASPSSFVHQFSPHTPSTHSHHHPHHAHPHSHSHPGMSGPSDLLMMSPPESPSVSMNMRRGPMGLLGSEIDRTRRPMNGFMLFAKYFRQEMIQANPGKDNRSISILLGDAWKRLTAAQRDEYSLCARSMAEEYKRAHPDCWKRKRTKVKQPKSVGQ